MYFIYLGNKDIYCIFKTCRIISVLFSTKCRLFHHFIFFCSIILTFFINYALRLKYQPSHLKVNLFNWLCVPFHSQNFLCISSLPHALPCSSNPFMDVCIPTEWLLKLVCTFITTQKPLNGFHEIKYGGHLWGTIKPFQFWLESDTHTRDFTCSISSVAV